MTRRKIQISTNFYYHIYNKTIGREIAFDSNNHVQRTLNLLKYYQYRHSYRYSRFKELSKEAQKTYLERIHKSERSVELHAYAIMPNHFHLLIKQKMEHGISQFISNFQNSFAKYYNLIEKREGGLFIRPFKAKFIHSEKQLLHISRYIHLNPLTSNILNEKDLVSSKITSFPSFINNVSNEIVETNIILNFFSTPTEYKLFVLNNKDYQRSLHLIKNAVIE